MPRTAKPFDRAAVITSLTVEHHSGAGPDSPLTPTQLDEMYPDTDKGNVGLRAFRATTKKKRKPRVKGSGSTKRETFSKTRTFNIPIAVTLTENQYTAGKNAGVRNAIQWGEHAAGFISSNSPDGVGAGAYIPKEARPEGCKVVHVDNLIAAAVTGLAEAAKYTERLKRMREVYTMMDGNAKMNESLDMPFDSPGIIRNKLTIAMGNAEYPQDQQDRITEELFGDTGEDSDADDDSDGGSSDSTNSTDE